METDLELSKEIWIWETFEEIKLWSKLYL